VTGSPDLLERTFPAPPDSFERLTRRRAQRARTRKITAGALALVLVVALVAALVGTLARRQQRSVPLNGPITPSNVTQLGLLWSSQVGGSMESAPLVVGDRVFVLDDTDRLRVYPTTCGSQICAPLWVTRLGLPSSWAWGGPVASGDRVYVPTSSGRLVAFPSTCGSSSSCRRVWSARLGNDMSSASPVIADGVVYVASDRPIAGGLIGAFPASCPESPRPCPPLWTGQLPDGFLGSQPVVANGVVYVGSKSGRLYAFPTSCADTGGRCAPLWTATTFDPPYATWSRMIAPILASGSEVFVPSGSRLYAYPTTCTRSAGACRPTWVAHTRGWINNLALEGDSVYVASTDGALSMLPQSCARICAPSWKISGIDGGANPTIADGVLYVGWMRGVAAFDASCGRRDGRCTPLWTTPPAVGPVINFPTVAGGVLYAGAEDGRLYAFAPGGSARLPGVASASASRGASPWYGVFYGAVLAAIVAFFVIRRRRTARQASDR
jgi:outer membrane protein assembly factor BamB